MRADIGSASNAISAQIFKTLGDIIKPKHPMKENFKEYHINEFVEEIYSDAIIVLDTNSILNLYRYSESNRNKYFEILKKVETRLYLTHQICKEFYKNRLIIIENRSTFKETINEFIEENISKLSNVITNCSGSDKYNSALSILKHEPTLKNSILKELEKVSKNIKTSINDFKQNFDINYIQSSDPILEEFVKIINEKVSDEITEEEKNKLYLDGENRYKNNIPPGFKDNDKGSPEKFGDLIIWNELQKLSTINKKPILFISDDRKEDWAIKFKRYDLGPRKELIKEFYTNTNNLFYSITTTKFIQIISDSYKISNIKKLQEETESIQKNFQQKEIELSKTTRKKYLELLERINTNPLENYKNSRELLDRINDSPMDQINKTREMLNRINSNPMEQMDRTREMLDRINNNPLEQINKTRELLDRINNNPMEQINKTREMLDRINSTPMEHINRTNEMFSNSQVEEYLKNLELLKNINKNKDEEI